MICKACSFEADEQQQMPRQPNDYNFHDDCIGCDCAHFDVGHGRVNNASQKGAE